ncbi:MAG: histidinol-phosphatase HisJ family protein [Lachnospiraceae bacterium]|nr:histidinol-phosphatase HisJ family protein [Lachnospiraceae bacterium]
MWDTHLHTEFSGDSQAKVGDMIAAGRAKGLSGMTFTDHLDWNYPKEPGRFDLDFYGYHDAMNRALTENPDIEIRTGIEIGLQPHLAERHREFLNKVPFDFVIGSIHVVDGMDPYYPEYFEGRNGDEGYGQYFECMKQNIVEFSDFDTLGHLDYVVRYGLRNLGAVQGAMTFSKHRDVIEEILDFLIKNEKSLEVNTGSFRNNMTEPNPSYEIIRLYREMGGRLITIGSDAHKPENVADGFEKVVPRLREMGFSSQAVYISRIIHEMPL